MSIENAIPTRQQKIDELNHEAWNIRVKDSPRALLLSKEALEQAREIHYQKGIADGARSLGFCFGRLAEYEQALPLLQESLLLYEKLNDIDGQANVIEYMGFIHRNQGDLSTALKLLYKSLSLSEQTGFPENIATGHYQLGVTYKHLGDYEKSLDHLYKSISVNREMKNTLYEAYSINVIGSIYFDNGDYEHALENYQQGLVARHEAGDKWGEAGSLDNIGFAYFKLKDFEQAIKYCNQSLAISRSTDDKRGQANVLLHLAEIYKQTNDLVKATNCSNESLEIRKTSGDKRGEAEILLFLAELHTVQTGDAKQVPELLTNALRIAEELGAVDLLSKTRFQLYEYYKRVNDYEKALENLDLHTNLEKEFHKNAINQKVKNLEITRDAEEARKETETEKLRNKELTALNEQIEKANAELRIESSLERVRTAAMAMKDPADMLEVCKIISTELAVLNVKEIRNVQTAIFYEEKGSYMNYEYYAKHDKKLITDVKYTDHPVAEKFAGQMIKGANEIFIHNFKGQEVMDWFAYQKTTNVFIDSYLENAESLNYYWYSLGPVALGISTYFPLSEEQTGLFKRFRNVFELAYRRYLDIEKAQVQAREAQIEVALERIRARAMAMHSSDELIMVANILREQMGLLGQSELETCVVNIVDQDTGIIFNWNAFRPPGFSSGEIITSTSSFAAGSSELTREMMQHYEEGEKEFTLTASGEKLREFFNVLIRSDPNVIRYMSDTIPEKVYYHFTSFTGGTLLTVSYQPTTEEVRTLQRRAASVFDMAYRRYRDLKKAEAQAREAQIEVALEKVRSRSLAMHKSEELQEVVHTVFEKLKELNIDFYTAIIILFEEGSKDVVWWLESKVYQHYQKILVPYADFPYMKDLFEARNNKIGFFSKSYPFEEKNKLFDHLFENTDLKYIPQQQKEFLYGTGFATMSVSLSKNTGLHITSYSRKTFSDEDNEIFKRFSKVFDQAYTRFLDLKKAEAQARESQIELGLERVRARAMAMQASDELGELVAILFEELTKLDLILARCIIWIFDNDTLAARMWMANSEDKRIAKSYFIKRLHHPYYNAILKGWKEKKLHWVYDLKGDDKKAIDKLLLNETELSQLPESVKSGILSSEETFVAGSFNNFGLIEASGPLRPSSEQLDILNRFGKVFDLSYTRFNDLKQAEAQAREARIEAALEKVRARVMAMTSSKDLNETSLVFGEQLRKLGIDWQFSYFWLIEEEKDDNTFWITWPDNKTSTTTYSLAEADENFRECIIAWKEQTKIHSTRVPPSDVQAWLDTFERITADAGGVAVEIMKAENFKEGVFYYDAMIRFGSFGILMNRPTNDEEKNIQSRFATEFERAYTRFLDLKNAEAQAREATIEAALERVRSRTMGMQKSDELREVIKVVYEQLVYLKINLDHAGFVVDYKTKSDWHFWIADKQDIPSRISHPYFKSVWASQFEEAKEKGNDLFTTHLDFEEKNEFYQELLAYVPGLQEESKNFYLNCPGLAVSTALMENVSLYIENFSAIPYTEEENAILIRFGKVFQQSYTRFLDLQKAEAQTREAKIEAALEKVRSRTMAMQKSIELGDVATVLFKELNLLVANLWTCGFVLCEKDRTEDEWWLSTEGGFIPAFHLPNVGDVTHYNIYQAWLNGEEYHTEQLEDEALREHYDWLMTIPVAKKIFDDFAATGFERPAWQKLHCAFFSKGYLCIITREPCHEEQIFKRFAQVFDLTYTRFLDLQKAETQAREAQIELALERVRARAMAMQEPAEFLDVIKIIGEQFIRLGFDIEWVNFGANGLDISEGIDTWNFAVIPGGDPVSGRLFIPYFDHPVFHDAIRQLDNYRRTGNDLFEMSYTKDVKDSWLDHLLSKTIFKDVPAEYQAVQYAKPGYTTSNFALKDTWLSIGKFDSRSFTLEQHSILRRIGNAFGLAYTRFLDLKKAEAQARDAQIEVALEKVRAKVMAMTTSKDLNETSLVFGEQLRKLGVDWQFSYFWLIEENKDDNTFWITWPDKKTSTTTYSLAEADENFRECIVAWKEQTKIHSSRVPVSDVQAWLDTFERISEDAGGIAVEIMKAENFKDGVFYYDAMIKFGSFGILMNRATNDEEKNIQIRFATEFERAYTRFLDLQKAEAQAREANIEAALERVRARALAMQEPEELKDVAQVLRTEMGTLGIEELETCSIYIHGDNTENVECWYALQDPGANEKKMISDHFVLNLDDTWVGREMKAFYGSNEHKTSIVMTGTNRREWIEHCYNHSPVFAGFYGDSIPDRTYHLYKFSHGYIGAASPGDISAESWKLLGRAASVFSLAYSRFRDLTQARNDLVKLKEEKKRAEDALTELQNTQKQLIQTEKMASLGELTAGIAHEIQNPLNFVNNFSDVNNELIEELNAERLKPNAERNELLINDLLINLKENEEKINHHGRRADAIVKSMLQHSRSSSGKKELADINSLTEEYLRLAYHGLRAKDKSFNAKFETALDKSIDKINIVPQEMGRVILNLINNAFYAVNEKKKKNGKTHPESTKGVYEPFVLVSTRKTGNQVEIKVKDNGDGIPQKILDKIFQPFFTTKPTGQGTGLGLSLSYDIVTKGHGGDLIVKTKEGEGAEFIISLPLN